MKLTDKWWEHPVLVARFEMRYQRGAEDECWPWTAQRNSKGYGMISTGTYTRAAAHRLALERKIGEPLGRRWALHSCDNPPCVNPAHLRPGDVRDNNRDKAERGRAPSEDQRCDRNKAAKLTNAQVLEIRRLADARAYSQTEIGRMFGVSQSTVSEIKNRKHWKLEEIS